MILARSAGPPYNPPHLALTPGTRLGPYEITAQIGVGGMGEVYRATDTNLKRQVAIKVLPASVAGDTERLARFQREAEVLAALNHPHIAAIYGLEKAPEFTALVMELVEGDDLSQRIAKGAIPVDEALPIAKQIAEALEAAHEQGIIHRDLKPANIKVRSDGTVKVLDFGLAKAVEGDRGQGQGIGDRGSVSQAPTITTPAMMTGVGMIFGTAAYMSPEQASGKPVDKRSDLWSFGVVLLEMLTGQRVFDGETVAHVIAAVLAKAPDWTALPANTPAAVRKVLRRCLEKDPRRRVRDAGDLRLEIDDALAEPVAAASPVVARRVAPAAGLALVLGGAIVAALATWGLMRSAPSGQPVDPEVRLDITAPPTSDTTSLAISPDGRTVAFAADVAGRTQLVLRPIASDTLRPLKGTEGGARPFWSPDSRSLGFFADSKLKRIDVDTGVIQVLASAQGGSASAWNRDGVILFLRAAGGSILRVPVNGGDPAVVVKATNFFSNLQFLDDGQHFLYSAGACVDKPCLERPGTYVSALDGSDTRFVLDVAAVRASSGQVFYVRDGSLFAQAFDAERLEVAGTPRRLAEQVGPWSVSDTGVVAYRSSSGSQVRSRAAWRDRTGKLLDDGSQGVLLNLALPPDGRRIAFQQGGDIYLRDVTGGSPTRLTFDPGIQSTPVWSPDARQVAFASGQGASEGLDLYVKPATGAEEERLLLEIPSENLTPMDWSPDGRVLLYRRNDTEGKTGFDLWAYPMDGVAKPFPLIRSEADEQEGQFSPDGKWIAYQSNESGRFEVYIQPFAGPDATSRGKWQISSDGGAQVRWRRDGKELFYIALDGQLTAVPIRVSADGGSIERGTPAPLFQARPIGGVVTPAPLRQQYVASADGQRFLVNSIVEDVVSPITVIMNWTLPER